MASALKTVNMVDPEVMGGFGSEYAEKYAAAQQAEQKLMQLLQQRNQSSGASVSPSMLAFAGEMLDPGRTGSFGEGLGRGIKSYVTARQAEDKDIRENAMLQMQLAQMGASQALKRQAMQDISGMIKPGAGGATPDGVTPGGGPAVTIRGMQVTPAIIARMKMVDKDMGEALETEYKLQLESLAPGQGYVLNKATGKIEEIPGAEMKDEYIPEIKGTIKMPMGDAAALREARGKGDASAVYKIIDKYQTGVGGRPAAPAPAVTEEAPRPAGTIEEREIEKAREKEVATTLAKDRAERTSKFLASADESKLSRAAAAENIQILSKNPKIAGYLNKPGVGNALWQVIQDSIRAHTATGGPGMDINIQKTDLESALQKVDPDFKLSDFTDMSVLASNIARMELGMRKAIYAGSGMGSVSNLEGQPIKDIIGNKYDTADALVRKMMLAGRSFDFDMDVADAYRKWNQKQGGNKTLEDFKNTSQYTKLSEGFEKWLATNLKIPYRKRGAEPGTASSTSILDEIKRRKGNQP